MGFQGQLSSVNLADIFQTLHMNRQTGTLTVTGTPPVNVWFDQGDIALVGAPPVGNLPMLLHTLVRRGLVPQEQVPELVNRVRSTGQPLNDLLVASQLVQASTLDEIATWCIEELVCPVFERTEGEFTFADGPPIPALSGIDVVAMTEQRVPTTNLILEATRRKDEWKRIREVIPDPLALFIIDNEGRANLRNMQCDAEMMKVLNLLTGRRSLDAVASATGMTRFDTFAVVAQFVLAGVARPRNPDEIVADAMELRQQGELTAARDLLEVALKQAAIPEVIRPLAEICEELQQGPRAVELYLELIQNDQDQGNLEQALKDLDRCITLSPEDPELHFERAQVRAELGLIEEAAAGYVLAAQSYIQTRDLPRAVDACHRAKNLLPRSPDPHRFLAKTYLMDGQTDNAAVEYKALWHALLTTERPRKAFEKLKEILDSDCKFQAIKEQVLSHALNSEAVKTSKATRLLVYALLVLVLVGAGLAGWEYVQRVVRKNQAMKELGQIEYGLTPRKESLEHARIIEELEELQSRYATIPEMRNQAGQLLQQVKDDFEVRAQAQLQRGDQWFNAGDYVQAQLAYETLHKRYPNTAAAANAEARIENVRQKCNALDITQQMTEAERHWKADDWDGALAALDLVLRRRDLPTERRAQLAQIKAEWQQAAGSAQQLFARAQRIEQAGNVPATLAAYRLAIKGEGAQAAASARERLRKLERDQADRLVREIQQAAVAERTNDEAVFVLLDQLELLAHEASNEEVKALPVQLEIPFTLAIDHPRTVVTLKPSWASEQAVRAPEGRQGPWEFRTTLRAGGSLTIAADRPGYAHREWTIGRKERKVGLQVSLVRGWAWRRDLGGQATAQPVAVGTTLLVPTSRDKPALDLVAPATGDRSSIPFADTVAELRQRPFVMQSRAYLALEDRIFCIDLNAHSLAWAWPSDGPSGRNLTGGLWVQPHELIQGMTLIFAGSARDGVLVLAAAADGRVTPYPRLPLDQEPSGAALAVPGPDGRSALYVPCGNRLEVFDITGITETSAGRKLYNLPTRGDLTGRPVRAQVGGRAAVLVSDASGLVYAIDADPEQVQHAIGSWTIEGGQPTAPVLLGRNAYVSAADGRITAIALDQPNRPLWRFPASGPGLGRLAGEPAIGQRGLYVAGDGGLLLCLDPATGKERWRADLGSPALGGVAARDGRIFIPVRGGQLVCFEEGDE